MQAIEFVSKAHDGVVDLPREFQDWNGKPVRVILLEENAASKNASQLVATKVWEKTSGAWQGKQMVRERQGEYEQRLELK